MWMEGAAFAEEFKLMAVTFQWLALFSNKSILFVNSAPLRDTLYIPNMKSHKFGSVL